MAYVVYTTDALVCGTYRRNTADASFALLTAEAGMVYATARSVREERSRQRYALQDFSHVYVSLVRGKAGWRIGSVESKVNYYHAATGRIKRGAVVQVVKVVRRFIPAEGVLPSVFQRTHEFLVRVVSAQDDDVSWLLRYYELWLLCELGYVARAALPAGLALIEPVSIWTRPAHHLDSVLDELRTVAIAASQL